MPIRSGGPAPYAPSQTVLGLIKAYRSRGLQTPFTGDVLMRAGVPETLISRVTQSLRLLDLIDEGGNPTNEFEALRRAGDVEFPDRLAAMVRAAYAEVFKFVDPAQDDEGRIKDAFRAFEPLGQLTRMVTLFLSLCAEANIVSEGKEPKKAPPRRPGAAPAMRGAGKRTAAANSAARSRLGAGDGGGRRGNAPPALQGLLDNLPTPSRGWVQADRDRWIAAVNAAVDFAIPIKSAGEMLVSANGDDDHQ